MKKNNIEIQPNEFNVGIQPMKYQYRNPTNGKLILGCNS